MRCGVVATTTEQKEEKSWKEMETFHRFCASMYGSAHVI
jgi:hypothetical protein